MSGLDEKGLKAARAAYDEAQLVSGATLSVLNEDECLEAAIRAYLASATPADVGEEPVAAQAPVMSGGLTKWHLDNWPDAAFREHIPAVRATLADYATALERVVGDRDDARADHEWMTANRNKWQDAATIARRRAESAEAKLAEARKVIEPFAEASIYHAAFGDERPVRADGDVKVKHLRAARRFLEETK